MKRVIRAARTSRMSEATQNDWIYLHGQIADALSSFIASVEDKYDRMQGADTSIVDPEIAIDNLRDAQEAFASALTDLIISGAE